MVDFKSHRTEIKKVQQIVVRRNRWFPIVLGKMQRRRNRNMGVRNRGVSDSRNETALSGTR